MSSRSRRWPGAAFRSVHTPAATSTRSSFNREQLRADLLASRRQLQDICQQPVDSFAYPGGRSSVWMPDLLDTLGFHHAVDTRRGINQAPAARFAIARVGMPDTPVGDFKRAIRNLTIIDATH